MTYLFFFQGIVWPEFVHTQSITQILSARYYGRSIIGEGTCMNQRARYYVVVSRFCWYNYSIDGVGRTGMWVRGYVSLSNGWTTLVHVRVL
jgi:hypothetical protein